MRSEISPNPQKYSSRYPPKTRLSFTTRSAEALPNRPSSLLLSRLSSLEDEHAPPGRREPCIVDSRALLGEVDWAGGPPTRRAGDVERGRGERIHADRYVRKPWKAFSGELVRGKRRFAPSMAGVASDRTLFGRFLLEGLHLNWFTPASPVWLDPRIPTSRTMLQLAIALPFAKMGTGLQSLML